MGFFESMKSWAKARLSSAPEAPEQDEEKSEEKSEVKRFPNLGENIQQVMQTPEFERVMNAASPFLLASLGAWPGYWLYRGFDYHSHRAHVPLQSYIRQTFYQAKVLQFVIILTGIISIVNRHHNNVHEFPVDTENDS